MKVIVSHDVDHLFRSDHYKDLFYPKLWVRSTLEILKREYGFSEWVSRMLNPFAERQHHIFEVMDLDRIYGIPSSFFFGMEKGLGMSYGSEKASDIIRTVDSSGFDVGVHGINYDDYNQMKAEHNIFSEIIHRNNFGIRMHYVRYNNTTFGKLGECGYVFDSSEFDKKKGFLLKNPYKIGNLWEFPISIMDSYLPPDYHKMIDCSKEIIELARKNGIEYFTVLFHDYKFCDGYASEREWYKWIIDYLSKNCEFISFKDAITELEDNRNVDTY